MLLKIETGFAIGYTEFTAFSCAYAVKVRLGESFGRKVGLD